MIRSARTRGDYSTALDHRVGCIPNARNASGCDTSGLTLPVLDFDDGCAVAGGPVYRGCRMPGYQGTYFYADYCGSYIRSFRLSGASVTDRRDWEDQLGPGVDLLSSFGVDADGELYIVDRTGEVFKVVPAT